MRLTTELIQSSLSYLNPLKERELDLRGHKIPAIENLGVAGPHDAIDFTDNDIQILGNFPLSTRLRTLLLARNRISSIQSNLTNSLPSLSTLVLTSNHFVELADLDVLGTFGRLTHLVLLDNPVTKKEHYRLWIIWRCPSVRFFDYKKVKDFERKKANELFGSAEYPTDLASSVRLAINLYHSFDIQISQRLTSSQIMGIKSKAVDVAPGKRVNTNSSAKNYRIKLTDQERKKVEELIRNAKSLQEIISLEKELNEGRIPVAAMEIDDPMEE